MSALRPKEEKTKCSGGRKVQESKGICYWESDFENCEDISKDTGIEGDTVEFAVKLG